MGITLKNLDCNIDNPFPLPSLPEQEKIGEFLSFLDTEVEQAERLVSLLSDRKKAYAQRIFDRTLRFHDDNDNPYPKWEETRLGEAVEYKYWGSNQILILGRIDQWLSVSSIKSRRTNKGQRQKRPIVNNLILLAIAV